MVGIKPIIYIFPRDVLRSNMFIVVEGSTISYKKPAIAHSYRLSCIRKEKQREACSMLDNLLHGKGIISDGWGDNGPFSKSLTVGVGNAIFFIVFDFR